MKYYSGLDVSLKETFISIIDEKGKIVKEKLFAPPKRRRKTILNQSQRECTQKWIEENPNIRLLA